MTDNYMIVSFSEIAKWDTCQRQWFYQFGMGLRPIEESKAITTGVKGHKLLQSFYTAMREGKTKEEALAITHESAVKLMRDERLGDFPLALAWTLVDNYIRGNEFPNDAELVENRFLIPVSTLDPQAGLEDVVIGFTPDVVFRRPGNFYDIEDAKFVERLWSKSKLNRYVQSKLYQIFLNRMGYNVNVTKLRFFNVKTGKVIEQKYTLTKAEEKHILEDFIGGIREVIQFRKLPFEVQQKARRTLNTPACQFCRFEFPCTLQIEGKDATKTLEVEYVRNEYDYSR